MSALQNSGLLVSKLKAEEAQESTWEAIKRTWVDFDFWYLTSS